MCNTNIRVLLSADKLCDEVECGKGTCKSSLNYKFGFICECDNGWKRTRLDNEDDLQYLPCVIPNCMLFCISFQMELHFSRPATALLISSLFLSCFPQVPWTTLACQQHPQLQLSRITNPPSIVITATLYIIIFKIMES